MIPSIPLVNGRGSGRSASHGRFPHGGRWSPPVSRRLRDACAYPWVKWLPTILVVLADLVHERLASLRSSKRP